MNKYLVFAYFLIFILSFVICEDTDNACKKNEVGECTYTPTGVTDDNKCLNIDGNCQLKKCSDLNSNCRLYGSFNDQNCVENEAQDGCTLFSCSDMDPEKCYDFSLYDDKNAKCKNSGKSCKLEKCSDYKPPNCDNFSPKYNGQRCIASENQCVLKECSDYEKPNCGNFIPIDSEYRCVADPNDESNNICKYLLKECEDLPYRSCSMLSSFTRNGVVYDCIKKADKSGCEAKSCQAQPIDKCGDFIPINEYEKCVLNSEKTKCEIKSCADYDPNECAQFTPNQKSKKCYKDEQTNLCTIGFKKCSEFNNNECTDYEPNSNEGNYDQSCMPGDNNICTLLSCDSFAATECNKFEVNNDYQQCLNIGTSCKLVECEDLPSDQCNKFITENLNYKCISKDNECIPVEKECSELPVSYCKEKEYEMEDDTICVLNDKKDKCKVKGAADGSQQLHMAFLTIFIFALLF